MKIISNNIRGIRGAIKHTEGGEFYYWCKNKFHLYWYTNDSELMCIIHCINIMRRELSGRRLVESQENRT